MELKEQIIKALECCTYGGDITKSQVEVCSPCPYFNEGNCTDILKENALSLIKELTQANEMLSESYDHLEKTKDALIAERSKLTIENERLRAENDELCDDIACLEFDNENAERRTVRKMQERLTKEFNRMHITNFLTVEVRQWIIDQIAKEMIGEEND